MQNDFSEFLDEESSAIKSGSTLMSKVFLWMFLGIAITALTSLIVATNESIFNAIYGSVGIIILLLIVEFALVIVLSRNITKLSYGVAILCFMSYAIINGLTLSFIFILYELPSITNIFFLTAGMFAVMAIFGYTTKMDLSKVGNVLMVGLICIIIGTIVNMFLMNNTFDILLCAVGAVIFIMLTAVDIQKIKEMSSGAINKQINLLAIIGALTLYLDFINLFLKLLRLFANRRRN